MRVFLHKAKNDCQKKQDSTVLQRRVSLLRNSAAFLLFAVQARSSGVTLREHKIRRTASGPQETNEWTFIKIRAAEFEMHKLYATRFFDCGGPRVPHR